MWMEAAQHHLQLLGLWRLKSKGRVGKSYLAEKIRGRISLLLSAEFNIGKQAFSFGSAQETGLASFHFCGQPIQTKGLLSQRRALEVNTGSQRKSFRFGLHECVEAAKDMVGALYF